MNTRLRDNYGYLGMIFLSLLLLLWIIPEWSPPWPGYGMPPSLMPNLAAGFILALATIGLLRNCFASLQEKKALQGSKPDAKDLPKIAPAGKKRFPGWLHLLIFVIPCALLMPAMNVFGFIPSGLVFMLLIQWLCGQRKPLVMILVAALSIGLLWALMRFALAVPLP